MPRGGSPELPAGVTPAEPMSIGEVANPPFVELPDPATVFARRSLRFRTLANGHALAPYLSLLAEVADAQDKAQSAVPAAEMPSADRLQIAYDHAMPPLGATQISIGAAVDAVFMFILETLAAVPALNEETRAAITRMREAPTDARLAAVTAVLQDEIPSDRVAEHVLAAAALQVHLTRLAAQLDADALKRIADAVCPACGGAPVASAVVGREGSYGARFCTCSLCATEWNVPRIRCLSCGSEKGVAYHSLEGSDGHISGETCENCSSYVKMLHQFKDGHLDPVADDVASLMLDVVLGREGWQRASVNPFLAGY